MIFVGKHEVFVRFWREFKKKGKKRGMKGEVIEEGKEEVMHKESEEGIREECKSGSSNMYEKLEK